MPLALVPATFALGAILASLAVQDAMQGRLADGLTLPLAVVGIVMAAIMDSGVTAHLAGAALGYAILALPAAVRPHAVGLGDAKLLAAAGAWLGWEAMPLLLLLAAIGGLTFFLARAALAGRATLNAPMPFGIPIAAAMWLLWLYGPVAL